MHKHAALNTDLRAADPVQFMVIEDDSLAVV
jgi:hypothetical protein